MIATEAHDNPGAGPATPGLLVDPEWLGDRIGDQRVRTVDLRDREAYAGGHIPGSVQLDLEYLGERREGCDNMVLRPANFAHIMAGLGISEGDTVVAYDDHWGLPSARLIWALHYYGHSSAVVLNGGWDRWQEEGRPMTGVPRSDGPTPENSDGPAPEGRGSFEAHPNPDVSADFEWIADGVAREDVILLDTRSHTEFDQGHLPGAKSWDWFNAVPAGSWECSRDPETLRSELAALGVYPSDEVVAYCRSGMRAAHTYMVLRHAGFPRVRLYDGSWQEWSIRGAPGHHGKDDR
jgi:thiosulfate/3-mercaptopyruvate sulfurtransferase